MTFYRAIMGYFITQCLYVAAKLGIADILQENISCNIKVLAEKTNTDEDSLYRVMRCLVSAEFFRENENRVFTLNDATMDLRDGKQSWRDYVIFCGEDSYQATGSLLESVKTGKPAFLQKFGISHWDYLNQFPKKAEVFHNMFLKRVDPVITLLEKYIDFSDVKKIVDVGGSAGHLVGGILKKHVKPAGIVFDLPGVKPLAERFISKSGLDSRLQFIQGSFLEYIPSEADLYLMKFIIHDWDDNHARIILSNCQQAMSHKSRLLILDRLLDGKSHNLDDMLVDIQMLVMLGGKERTELEFQALCSSAGLKIVKIHARNESLKIIEVMRF